MTGPTVCANVSDDEPHGQRYTAPQFRIKARANNFPQRRKWNEDARPRTNILANTEGTTSASACVCAHFHSKDRDPVPLPQCVLFASLLLPTGWIKLSLANLGGLFFLFFSVGHPSKPSFYGRFACMTRHDWFVGLTVLVPSSNPAQACICPCSFKLPSL